MTRRFLSYDIIENADFIWFDASTHKAISKKVEHNDEQNWFLEIPWTNLVWIWWKSIQDNTSSTNNHRTIDFSSIYSSLNRIHNVQCQLWDSNDWWRHNWQQIFIRVFNLQSTKFDIDLLDLTWWSAWIEVYFHIIWSKV